MTAMVVEKKKGIHLSEHKPEIDDSSKLDRQVVVQFENAEGCSVGPQLHVSLRITQLQLQQLLNQIQESDEILPYAFKLLSPKKEIVEIDTNLEDALKGLKGCMTSETSLSIAYYPLASFRVRPVTRCTVSIQAHSEAVLCLAFSPDSMHLASGSGDTTVRIWDIDTETPLKTLQGHTNWVLSIEWSPDGTVLASAGMDKVIKIWFPFEPEKNNIVRHSTLRGHSKGITCLTWQPLHLMSNTQQLPHLASASLDCTIRIWDITRATTIISFSSHTLPVTQIRYSGNTITPCLFSCSRDTTVKVWDTVNGHLLKDLKGHGHWVNTLALNTEQIMQSGAYDHTMESRDITLMSARIIAAREKYDEYLKNSCGSKERIVTGSDDCTMFLWAPLTSNKPIARLVGHQKPVNHVQFSPNGQIIASGSFDNSIRLWDAITGKYIAVLRGHVGSVYRLSWASDGRSLATASADSTVKVWDITKKKLRDDLPGHADEVYALSWSIDGCRVASGSKDRYLKIWRH